MAEYIENVINQTSKLDWSFPFQRTGKFPIDRSALFSSYADAVLYAKGDGTDERALGGTSYVGQPISVYDAESSSVTLYLINADKTLKEVGSVPVGDGLTIEIVDGKIALKGAAEAEEGAQPRIKADGSIEWIVPSTETVDGLQTTVAGLQSDVGTLKTDMGTAKSNISELSDLIGGVAVSTQIQNQITGLNLDNKYETKGAAEAVKATIGDIDEGKTVVQMIEDAKTAATYNDTQVKADIQANADAITKLNANAETEGSVDYKIAQAVAQIIENPDDTMNSINELVTWCNDHASDALELSNKVSANENSIAALEDLVGGKAVAVQITEAIANELKIEGVDKYALASDLTLAIGRIASLEGKSHEHSNKDLLDTYTQTEVDLADAVTKKHGHANQTELDKIVDGDKEKWDAAQANAEATAKSYTDDVKTELQGVINGKVDKVTGSRLMTEAEAEKLEKLVIGEDGSVEVSGTIAAGNVTGLAEWLTARAGTLEGLSENNLTDALANKLNGIAEGAQVNVIDAVSDEFVISSDGKVLSVQAIAQDKITGLAEALAGKVDAIDGMGLSSNDFTDALLEKLNGIAAGAEVNYIKSVSDEFEVNDGVLSVNTINVNKLVQTDGEYLIMNGGSSAG